MSTIPLFFKPVFYNKEKDSILFKYDDTLNLIRIPQFIIRKEIKNDKDLKREMNNISKIIKSCGITKFGEPFAESSIKILLI